MRIKTLSYSRCHHQYVPRLDGTTDFFVDAKIDSFALKSMLRLPRFDLRPVVVAFCVLLLVVLWTTTLYEHARGRDAAIQATMLQTANLAAAFDEHVTRTIRGADRILLKIKWDFENGSNVDLKRTLAGMTFERDPFNTVSIADKEGWQIAASYPLTNRANFSDSENFKYHQTNPSPDLYISKPRLGVTTGRWSIYLSRRLDFADGSFAGDVVLALNAGYFSDFYRQFELGPQGTIALLGLDGIVRARDINGSLTAGDDTSQTTLFTKRINEKPSGSFITGGSVDGIVRIASYRRLKDYPLIVLVGVAQVHALAGFEHEQSVRNLWSAVFTALIVVFGVLMVSQLSRLRRANRRIADSEAMYRALIETTNTGYVVLDHAGRVLDANANYVVMTGHRDLAQIRGRHVEEWTAPYDRERNRREVQDCLERGFVAQLEVDYTGPQGRTVPIEISANVIGSGERQRILSLCRDISERRAAEAERRLAASVFSSAAEGIMITDHNNNIVLVNAAFSRIMGYRPDEVIGRNPRMLRSGQTSREFYEKLWQGLRTTGHWSGEIRDRRHDGSTIWLQLSVAVVCDNGGKVTHHHAIIADITTRKEAELKLEEFSADLERRVIARTAALTATNRELEVANKDLEAFSYSVSHDLRTPLRAVLANVSRILEAGSKAHGDETRERLEKARTAGERMARLMDDLLNLARFSRQAMHCERVDLSRVAREVVATVSAMNKDSRVEVSIQDGMICNGDRGLLFIVLQNLIGNAWKYSARAEAPRVEAGCEVRGGEAVYFVRDNGVGFDMARAGKLFEVFERLHTSAEFEGTGIGLSIVRRIVARHGGRVWAESSPGHGATFFFTLGTASVAVAPAELEASIQ